MAAMIGWSELITVGSGLIALTGLIAAAVFFLWHLREIRRTQASTERNLEATHEVGRETLSALQLHDVIVGDKHLEGVVKELAADYVRLSKHRDPLATFLAGHELDDIKRFMTMGAEGYITVGSDAFSHADRLASALLRTTVPTDEFWASSLVAPEFWSHATAYVGQQVTKAAEKVAINRVFVFDDERAFQDELAQDQMTLQAKDGIKVWYVINPPYEMRDLVVVRKPTIEPRRGRRRTNGRRAKSPASAVYAMECRVGLEKRIDHIDLWTTYGLHSTRVEETWWNLDAIFKQAEKFELKTEREVTVLPTGYEGPERRRGERRSGERRSGDRRNGDRRATPSPAAAWASGRAT